MPAERVDAPRTRAQVIAALHTHEREAFEASRDDRAELDRTDGALVPAIGEQLVVWPVVFAPHTQQLLFPTGEVVAGFASRLDRSEVQRWAQAQGWSIARVLRFLPNGYVLRTEGSHDVFDTARALVERQGCELAHPVFLETLSDRSQAHDEFLPRLFAEQWHLIDRGGPSATKVDINVATAWAVTRGSPDITVAIIDSGVQRDHEVFQTQGKLTHGYDFAEHDEDPEPTVSDHGTACASVAVGGALGGASLGVAPLCRLMPIRRGSLSSHLDIADAIAWAVDHGADVLSCSFGFDGQRWVLPDVVRAALSYAQKEGRGGRGMPIFWAAGNGDELVSDDEWASCEHTIAVAATTDRGGRAPYSDYGPQIELSAPSSGGVRGITTAVNHGYTSSFGGTSAAAPIAAGVAALVLSVAPELSVQELRLLLRRSARQLDDSHNAEGHSDYFGAGLVDARAALDAIDVQTQVLRIVGLEASASGLTKLRDAVMTSDAGRELLAWIAARRLLLLVATQSAPAFREALMQVIPPLAALGEHHYGGSEPVIPDHLWPLFINVIEHLNQKAPQP